MQISGFEKLTLTDFPNNLACIIFTQGCNFSCPFCQNSDLIKINNGLIDLNTIYDYLEKRKNVLDGIVISGGEPTVQKDLKQFIQRLKQYNLKIKLDTNGSNYDLLKDLIESNLIDYVAMDIKNEFESYNKICGKIINIENIKKSIELLKKSNIDYEFRTTIIKEFHDIEKIKKICKYIGNSKYFLQNFQDNPCVLDKNLTGFSESELKEIQKNISKEFPNAKVRGI